MLGFCCSELVELSVSRSIGSPAQNRSIGAEFSLLRRISQKAINHGLSMMTAVPLIRAILVDSYAANE